MAYPDDLIHHSPNEGNRGGRSGAIDGRRRKDMGVLAGFPDIFQMGRPIGCPMGYQMGGMGRLWFWEVKAPGGQTSASQRQVGQMITSLGGRWAIVRSVEDVKARAREWSGEWSGEGSDG